MHFRGSESVSRSLIVSSNSPAFIDGVSLSENGGRPSSVRGSLLFSEKFIIDVIHGEKSVVAVTSALKVRRGGDIGRRGQDDVAQEPIGAGEDAEPARRRHHAHGRPSGGQGRRGGSCRR